MAHNEDMPTTADFKAFKTELRNAPVITFTANSQGWDRTGTLATGCGTVRTIKVNGRWIKVEG